MPMAATHPEVEVAIVVVAAKDVRVAGVTNTCSILQDEPRVTAIHL